MTSLPHYDIDDIVQKLIGPVNPVGDANIDADRLWNLKQMTHLIDLLLAEVLPVANGRNAHQASISKAAGEVDRFIDELRETIGDPQ